MGLIRSTFCFILLLLLAGSAFLACAPQRQDLPGELEMPGQQTGQLKNAIGKDISIQEWVNSVRGADYILIGESHTNNCDHEVQARLLQALVDAGVFPVLGLEMLDVSIQDKVDEFNSGQIGAKELPDQIKWSEQWGYPFSLYAPLFELALENSLPVAALNLPRKILDQVRSKGLKNLSEKNRSYLPEEVIPVSQEQKKSLKKVYKQHQEFLEDESGSSLERFMLVQSIWDTKMAEQARKWQKKTDRPVLIITGVGHVEYDWGIAHRLKSLDPGARVVSVAPWRGTEKPDPKLADYVYFCPLTHKSRLGMQLRPLKGGIEVLNVDSGSRADKAGLKAGDLILRAQDIELEELMDLHKAAMRAKKEKSNLSLKVMRAKSIKMLEIDLQKSGADVQE